MGLSSSKAVRGELQDRSEVKAETELLMEVSGTCSVGAGCWFGVSEGDRAFTGVVDSGVSKAPSESELLKLGCLAGAGRSVSSGMG